MKIFSTHPRGDAFPLKKLLRQNLVFILVLLLLMLIFGMLLYLGSRQIYDEEEQWRGQKTMAEVNSGKTNINNYFSDLRRDLDFTLALPELKNYYSENFTPTKKMEAEHVLTGFLEGKQFYQITVTDSSEAEVLEVSSKSEGQLSWPSGLNNRDMHKNLFPKSIKLGKDQVALSPVYYATEKMGSKLSRKVLMTIAMPIIADQTIKGVVFIDLDLTDVFKILPNTQLFMQTNDGMDIFLNQDGSLDFKRLNYPLTDNSNWYSVNDMERIHYSPVSIFAQQPFILAEYHQLPLLKVTLGKLRYIFAALFLIFLSLVVYSVSTNLLIIKKLFNTQKAIVFSLAALAEGRDQETGRHLERSRDYAVILAQQLKTHKKYRKVITDEFIDTLYYAATLHDIGKVAIPDAILLKEGKLNEAEYAEIKKHVITGKNILKETINKYKLKESFLEMGMRICAYHHEKYNGKGYPQGLKGRDIPIEARIFALCDAYDAIRSKRSYKGDRSHQEAKEKIMADINQHFDPEVVEAFLECENKFADIK